jgi:chromosome segregation ATPase
MEYIMYKKSLYVLPIISLLSIETSLASNNMPKEFQIDVESEVAAQREAATRLTREEQIAFGLIPADEPAAVPAQPRQPQAPVVNEQAAQAALLMTYLLQQQMAQPAERNNAENANRIALDEIQSEHETLSFLMAEVETDIQSKRDSIAENDAAVQRQYGYKAENESITHTYKRTNQVLQSQIAELEKTNSQYQTRLTELAQRATQLGGFIARQPAPVFANSNNSSQPEARNNAGHSPKPQVGNGDAAIIAMQDAENKILQLDAQMERITGRLAQMRTAETITEEIEALDARIAKDKADLLEKHQGSHSTIQSIIASNETHKKNKQADLDRVLKLNLKLNDLGEQKVALMNQIVGN